MSSWFNFNGYELENNCQNACLGSFLSDGFIEESKQVSLCGSTFLNYQIDWESIHNDNLILRGCPNQFGRKGLAWLVTCGGWQGSVEVSENCPRIKEVVELIGWHTRFGSRCPGFKSRQRQKHYLLSAFIEFELWAFGFESEQNTFNALLRVWCLVDINYTW